METNKGNRFRYFMGCTVVSNDYIICESDESSAISRKCITCGSVFRQVHTRFRVCLSCKVKKYRGFSKPFYYKRYKSLADNIDRCLANGINTYNHHASHFHFKIDSGIIKVERNSNMVGINDVRDSFVVSVAEIKTSVLDTYALVTAHLRTNMTLDDVRFGLSCLN